MCANTCECFIRYLFYKIFSFIIFIHMYSTGGKMFNSTEEIGFDYIIRLYYYIIRLYYYIIRSAYFWKDVLHIDLPNYLYLPIFLFSTFYNSQYRPEFHSNQQFNIIISYINLFHYISTFFRKCLVNTRDCTVIYSHHTLCTHNINKRYK